MYALTKYPQSSPTLEVKSVTFVSKKAYFMWYKEKQLGIREMSGLKDNKRF